jgi:bifunctional UDP-N-acetylglucosamine pyrophosphorylase/glucosamine-1-phosphate N-acetyltransferase
MKSALPKVMHRIAGLPMLEHVYNRSQEIGATDVHIVYGHGGEHLRDYCSGFDVNWVIQEEQLGTAHAVQQGSPDIDDENIALVLYGDVPLIKSETLKTLVSTVKDNDIALLTVNLEDPTGYGRIVRDNEKVVAIVEHKDASEQQKEINEVNTGILAVRAGYLNECLAKIDNNNSQGEYYLTDIIAMAVADGNQVKTTQPQNTYEVEGVNDRNQLAVLERIHQLDIAKAIMADGVTIADPARDVQIGAGCIIKNSTIACDCIIKPYSVIEDAVIYKNVEVGPFARLRPGANLKENSRVGNFVEIKNTELGKGSKASHLTYLGDTEVGSDVNIGAGTITCNYDGVNKHKTIIKDGAFIGSTSQLVAPVTIGKNATIGAGSTITRDAEDDALTLTRTEQKTLKGWQRPKK